LKIPRTDPKVLRQLMEQAARNATRSISIRVPIADLEEAKRIAEKAGVGYQTVLKQAIREGLKRAG
jgi:predicted DNA binding CopG/RHH family protein